MQLKAEFVEQLRSKFETEGVQDAQSMLHGDSPAPVRFANRNSCSIYKHFVADTIDDLVRVGSMAEWRGHGLW